jgi:23S rRNA pseudouridine1911/1915/1917 synthase
VENFQFEGKQPERLDRFMVTCLPEFSRSRLQGLISDGFVLVNGNAAKKAGQILEGGENISIRIPPPVPSKLTEKTSRWTSFSKTKT